MPKKPSLGRGLDSLFLENEEAEKSSVSMLRTSDVEPNPHQPRKHFDEEALASLADSISMHGLLQPIAVRRSMGGFYQIIAGERRWRASKIAGLSEIPAIIYDIDDKKAAELALIENIQREDLNPIEEAIALRTLINDYGLTQEDASRRIGKSRSAIANALRLLDLPEKIVSMVADGKLSPGHARAIMSLKRKKDMLPFALRICEKELSVRDAEHEAKLINLRAEKEARGEENEPTRESAVAQSYLRSLERRASQTLGNKFRIYDPGKGKAKRIEITYTENDDLETILKRLCGDDFFDLT